MAIDIDWGNFEETFLVWKFTGKWTSEDYYTSLDHLERFTRERDVAVELIVDMRYSITSPSNLISMVQASYKRNFDQIEAVIIISRSNYWERIYNIVRSNLKSETVVPVQFVTTVDEAYSMIQVET